jgi:hypothetical protein
VTTLTVHQRQVAEHLIDGLSVTELAEAMGFTRSRGQELISTLRTKGVLTTELPEHCTTKTSHPANTARDPFPRRAHYARLFEATPHELVVRSTIPPREDGLELPQAVPDECSLILSRRMPPHVGHQSWPFVASRRAPWPIRRTQLEYRAWENRLARYGRTLPVLDANQTRQLTQVIAWAIGVEAILYEADHTVLPLAGAAS